MDGDFNYNFLNKRMPISKLKPYNEEFFILSSQYIPYLKSLQIKIILTLIKNKKPLTVKELSTLLNKTRDTVQKSLNKLINENYITRYKQTTHKSFKYLYENKTPLKQLVKEQINLKYNTEITILNNFDLN